MKICGGSFFASAVVALAMLTVSCTPTEEGAFVGGAIGTAAGGALTDSGTGALVGGLLGAAVGAAIADDRSHRRSSYYGRGRYDYRRHHHGYHRGDRYYHGRSYGPPRRRGYGY
ncbi:MAG: glycine zipper domain-containing protein [Verrucomicrobiales bacterium]|nr:glycine zipper domain-containing protein [Verrucomicrobiales bacterium]